MKIPQVSRILERNIWLCLQVDLDYIESNLLITRMGKSLYQ